MYDDTPPCSPHGDEGLYNQEYDATNEESPIFHEDVDDNYWTYIEKPIFYVSREGSVDLETFEDLGV